MFDVGDKVFIILDNGTIEEAKVEKVFPEGSLSYGGVYYIVNVFTEDYQGLEFRPYWEVWSKRKKVKTHR